MKRIIKIVTIVILILLLVAGGVLGYFIIEKKFTEYEEAVAYRDGVIQTLNTKIENIGPLTTCYELNYDVKSGTIIEESDLTPVEIPEKSSVGYVTDINNALGMRYKTNLGSGTILHDSLMTENELTRDSRYIDVPVEPTGVPIGIEPGDYIDIRVTFTRGQDFIAMSHKEVVQINSNIIKIVGDEIDILTLQSLKKDKSLYAGCEIYGIQYVEGGVQESATNYYPIRIDTLASAAQNDGFDWTQYADSNQFNLENRELLENTLISYVDINSNVDMTTNPELYMKKLYAEAIASGNTTLMAWYQSGLDYYNSIQNGDETTNSGGSNNLNLGDQVGVGTY